MGHPSRSSRSPCGADLPEQASPVAHVYEHVHVTVGSRVAARDRPKHAHRPRTMTRRDPHDLVAAAAQLVKARRWPVRARIRIRPTPTFELTAEITQPLQREVPVLSRDGHNPDGND